MVFIALLRGINVGGNTLIKMAELKTCLEKAGLSNIVTYIQSGNIIFSSDKTDTVKLAKIIQSAIKKQFDLEVPTLVISKTDFETVIKSVPKGWGGDPEWRYNLWFLLPPYDEAKAVKDVGELKPDIEILAAGKGVLYQALSFKLYGRTTTSKIVGKPLYKQITIRNHRTGNKLLDLMNSLDK